jgi:nitroimidazol reductase NimA-like FMN-containing flavoprotein (pyridoxamine 5'-phosphate oxidase superfamily)
MAYPTRALNDAEREAFIKDNMHGILSFAGDDPYAIPLGYMYIKDSLLVGFGPGKKMDYLNKSRKVCFTICRPRYLSPNFKESCTTLILDGQLEEVADPSYYGVKMPEGSVDGHLYLIKPTSESTRKCLQDPCDLLSGRVKAPDTLK